MIAPGLDEPRARVLVVDDDAATAHALGHKLTYVGYAVEVETTPRPVIERLAGQRADWDVVLLDVGLPEISGIDVLKRFRDSGSLASVIMLTGDGSATTATACLRAGAFHYLIKPCLPIELASTVESAARHTSLRRRLARGGPVTPHERLIGEAPAIRRLQATIDRLALQDVPVLIQGESGTGKELVARALHASWAASGAGRKPGFAQRPFLAINCSAIPDTLIDSELFGHARGAFTGATADRDGLFVQADGGTLFLDEIGDMPLAVQPRLLRVLQEGEVRPLGNAAVRKVDVRVVAATHVNLADAVAAGRFREDLYYRLHVVALHVPPLRERPGDIPLLAAHFLRKHSGSGAPTISPEALDVLVSDAWPGNVRELENAILHAIAFHHGDRIGVEDLPAHIGARSALMAPPTSVPSAVSSAAMLVAVEAELEQHLPLTEAKRRINEAFERAYLVKVMERARGSMSEAARLAGIDRTNLRRLLKRHDLRRGRGGS
ncbi:MAG TPA: sigma-54 dependent transcriptional regulator [Kofleriaceae bacterium]|nr:sigma-54 dependent transcriptional regulator [Kofleriaceae bacterium]